MVARRLRELRLARGWSLDELARRAGVSLTAVSFIESGITRTPHARTLYRVARTLGVPLEALRAEEAPPSACPGIIDAYPAPGPAPMLLESWDALEAHALFRVGRPG